MCVTAGPDQRLVLWRWQLLQADDGDAAATPRVQLRPLAACLLDVPDVSCVAVAPSRCDVAAAFAAVLRSLPPRGSAADTVRVLVCGAGLQLADVSLPQHLE
jgi:hypothetical protein